jgi:hypothetical protein
MSRHPAFAIASSPGARRTELSVISPSICQNARKGTHIADRHCAVVRAVFDMLDRLRTDADPHVGPQSQTVAKLSKLADVGLPAPSLLHCTLVLELPH